MNYFLILDLVNQALTLLLLLLLLLLPPSSSSEDPYAKERQRYLWDDVVSGGSTSGDLLTIPTVELISSVHEESWKGAQLHGMSFQSLVAAEVSKQTTTYAQRLMM